MADRGNVIKGLERHLARLTDDLVNGMVHSCRECPYRGEMNCSIQLIANALELLKEQDAVEPVKRGRWGTLAIKDFGGNEYVYFTCSECNETSNDKFDYCPFCGAKMDSEVE